MHDFDTPEGRAQAAEVLGPHEYDRQHRAHMQRQTVTRINGYPIRRIATRFGRLWSVDGTGRAFAQIEQAREYARSQPPHPAA